MKKQVSFPKIGQLRVIVDTVAHQTRFVELDADGECIYDNDIKLPTLTFSGTTKIHGTNSGVSYNKNDGIWYQSNKQIITPDSDNAGFAFFAESRKESFLKLMDQISKQEDIDLDVNTLTIYGRLMCQVLSLPRRLVPRLW